MATKQPENSAPSIGDKVANKKYVVRKKLGEGSCGSVWLVESVKNPNNKFAMKVEQRQKSKDEEILRMEMYVLKKLQSSMHVARFIASGTQCNYSFMIMTLLGKDLVDSRRKCASRKVSGGTVLRLALQGLQALEDMHKAGFLHRDVKPCNFAMGIKNKKLLIIFDFGLCRQFLLPDKNGKLVLRDPRTRVSFRGTVRYCSLNVHLGKEQGRHDDLISLLFSMIETTTGTLPWKGLPRVEAHKCKEQTSDAALLKGCPPAFTEYYANVKNLGYRDTPPYERMRACLAKNIRDLGVKMTDEYDWEVLSKAERKENKEKNSTLKDNAEKDKGDNDTSRDIDESVASQVSENVAEENCDPEDTLDQAPDRMKTEDHDGAGNAADR